MKTTKTKPQTANPSFLILFITLILAACSGNHQEVTPSDEFAPYIYAYTGGVISQSSGIRIELAQDQPMVDLNRELEENPFNFSPPLKGKTCWISTNTLEFTPEEGALKPGKIYEGTFRLGDFAEVDKHLQKFKFSFRVQERHFTLQTDAVTVTEAHDDLAEVKGEIRFNDCMTKETVEKMLSAHDDKGTRLPVSITETGQPIRYQFQIGNIPRKESDYTLTIKADGTLADIDSRQQINVQIPARGNFRFLAARRIDQPENGIEILFSDPISTEQELKGLIEIPEVPSSIFQVRDNKIYAYFESNRLNKLTLNIHEGVKTYKGEALGRSHALSFGEVNLPPQVELKNSAAILPDSRNLLIPFRAVNLYAVDLSVIRIFESNVLAFMQSNDMSSSSELRRYGRLVYKKTLPLTEDPTKNVHRWEDYSIDLAGLIRQEPGAIYRIILSFKQEYSAYPCSGKGEGNMLFADSPVLTKVGGDVPTEEEEAVWDIPQSYYYYNGGTEWNWREYDWRERDNPCHPSYYMNADRAASCNVFASNLGMIVKRNSSDKLWISVNNLLSTDPVKKAQVTAYNFQLQPIGTATTNQEGFAEITPKGVPFLLTAEADGQKAYVRVADGEEQSMSRFDVGGKEIQKGLKGFIYGERGVWRPGDTLHISFILEDRERKIPNHHPVALELYNPQGQFHSKQITAKGMNGFYIFHLPTSAEDPTGLWNAYIKVGGSTFHKSLRIETIKPNRLKIDLRLPQKTLQASAQEAAATVSASWLTGATASRLRTKVEMSLSKVNTQFPQYQRYQFNNPATEFTTLKTELFDGMLDAQGKTNFSLKLPQAAQAPGLLNATLTTRVFEPGGDASIHIQSMPFSPFSSYVGIDLHQPTGKYMETDQEHRFDIVTVDAQGRPTDRTGLEYKIYRIDWSWWWEESSESLGNYINNHSITPVASGRLQTTGGKTSFTFRVDYPEWGRYLVYVKDRESGHATGGTIYIDWPEWRGRSDKSDPSGIKMLAFSIDKESYEIGETATAILPAAAGGRALVSLENGSNVLKREWIEVNPKGDTKYTFKITPEMAPNVYLHISLLQPHAQTVNDLPIRMYGVVPVLVTDKQTLLHPQIQQPDVLRPESDFQVTVSEKEGKPMTYTLALVDDGLLDLTNFRTPDPWNEFYVREALGIRTWDMYDHVLGATAGRCASLFSTGGDEMLKPADAKANRFKPVVKFIGPFHIGKGERKSHTLRLPMYVGSVRTMVIAGQDGAYGNAEKTAQVRTPLMLLSTMPRILSIGEEITIPVNLFALEKEIKEVKTTLHVSGTDLQVCGTTQQSTHFQQPGDQLIYFKLKTGKQTGKATIRLTAEGGGKQAKESIEIEVRNPNPAVTLRQSQWIESGKEGTLAYSFQGASAAESRLQLEVSRIPSVDISRRLDFLYNYPHSCTEQLTSKALPLLFAGSFKEMDNREVEQIKASVQESIRRLYGRQLPNGGFACWPGSAVADEWVTSYAGMFLTLAQERGYAVHTNVLNQWKRFQQATAQNWRMTQLPEGRTPDAAYLQQAYRLYTLALAGAPEYGAMNRMKELQGLPRQARWSLAAAYALTGKPQPAGELTFNQPTTAEAHVMPSSVYGSSDRDEAMILETLILMGRESQALQLAKKVSQNLAREDRFETQSTAFALMAMARLAEKLSGTIEFGWSLNGKAQPTVKSAKAVFTQTLSTTPNRGTIVLTNRGEGALSADLIRHMQLLNDTLPALNRNLQLDVKYTDMQGTPISINRLKQGTDFMAHITVSNLSPSTDYDNLALTHILPSGWEVYNERMYTAETGKDAFTYRDFRDDRILTYFGLKRGERKSFPIRLQATYMGHFTLPAIQCEAMYDTETLARTKAGKTVVEP